MEVGSTYLNIVYTLPFPLLTAVALLVVEAVRQAFKGTRSFTPVFFYFGMGVMRTPYC